MLSEDRESLYKIIEYPFLADRCHLTDEQKIQTRAYLVAFLRMRENHWLQFQRGVLDEATWQSYRAPLSTVVLNSEVGRGIWETSRYTFDQKFAASVDELLSETPIAECESRNWLKGDIRADLRARITTACSGRSDQQVRESIEKTGRGWVIESEGAIVAFAIGNAENGNIWALFVDPTHEHRGYGRLLHDTMVEWLFSRGLERLWLTTEPGTRAQRFYEAAGWERIGLTNSGELRFERIGDVK
jgi:GNAT superfamily N-acetyltransferase